MKNNNYDSEGDWNYSANSGDTGELIKNSLKKIKWQTSRHLCINTGLPIESVLDWLDGNGDEVRSEAVGAVQVYYLEKNKPSGKLYLGGADGRTICLEERAEIKNTGTAKIGDQTVLPTYKKPKVLYHPISGDEQQEADELPASEAEAENLSSESAPPEDDSSEILTDADGEIETKKTAAKTGSKKIGAPKAGPDSASLETRLEQYAADGITQKGAALLLGIGYSTLQGYLSASDKLEAAWKRGRKAAKQKKIEKKNLAAAEKNAKPKKSEIAPKNLTPEEIENLAEKFGSYESAADSIDTSVVGFRRYIVGNNENMSAWRVGQQRFIKAKMNRSNAPETSAPSETRESETISNPAESAIVRQVREPPDSDNQVMTDPRFAHTLEHIAEYGHSRESIEAVKAQILDVGLPPMPPAFAVPAKFGDPQLFVTFDGDFVNLPKEKRDLLARIADLKDMFEGER